MTMRAPFRLTTSAAVILLSGNILLACAYRTSPGTQVTATTVGELDAQVVAVDKANRQVTLREPDGTITKLTVQPEVRNFEQIAVGNTVRINYRARIDMLVAGSAAPIKDVDVTTTVRGSEAGQKPSGFLGSKMTLTVQVVSVDRATHTAIFRKPDGSIDSITAVEPANFNTIDGLQPGTKVLVTVTRAIEASVDRA